MGITKTFVATMAAGAVAGGAVAGVLTVSGGVTSADAANGVSASDVRALNKRVIASIRRSNNNRANIASARGDIGANESAITALQALGPGSGPQGPPGPAGPKGEPGQAGVVPSLTAVTSTGSPSLSRPLSANSTTIFGTVTNTAGRYRGDGRLTIPAGARLFAVAQLNLRNTGNVRRSGRCVLGARRPDGGTGSPFFGKRNFSVRPGDTGRVTILGHFRRPGVTEVVARCGGNSELRFVGGSILAWLVEGPQPNASPMPVQP